jgi:steroid 5-alpha reductase family enzyme
MNRNLQTIFLVCVLAMWWLFGSGLADNNWTNDQWAMLIIAHIVCLVVFHRFAYIFSYGYGLSMLCISLWLMFKFRNLPALLIGGLCAAYGLRLWQFVFARHRARAARGDPDNDTELHRRTPMGVKIFIWIMVSWLMAFMGMTTWLAGTRALMTPWIVAGAIVMVLGLGMETIADNQKQVAKTAAPDRWVATGLFTRIRQANYAGEIVFQLGLMLAAIGTALSAREYLLVWVAPFYVIMLMIFQASILDDKQQTRYGKTPEYQAWRARSGRLLPFA